MQGNLDGEVKLGEGKERKQERQFPATYFICVHNPKAVAERGLINEVQNEKKLLSFEGSMMILKACQLQFEKSYNEQTVPALVPSPHGQFTR